MAKRYFQWIDGEMKGDIVSLVSIEEFDGEYYYTFDDDERCNSKFISKMTNNVTDLKGKFMVEIESPSNSWSWEEVKPKIHVEKGGEEYEIPSLHDIMQGEHITKSDIGTEKLVPPRRKQNLIELPDPLDYQPKLKKEIKKPAQVISKTIDNSISDDTKPIMDDLQKVVDYPVENKSSDPIRILVDKCKKKETEVNLVLKLNLPSVSFASVVSDDFDNGLDRFIDCIVDDIDTKSIIDELKVALHNSYSDAIKKEN